MAYETEGGVMSKTPEEIYEERVAAAGNALVTELLQGGVDHLTVVEFLSEVGEDDGFDFVNDIHARIQDTLETLLQRHEEEA